MVEKGDILKASDEMRPRIKEYLKAFGVDCSQEERVRIRKIAEEISDYDPAGKFSYLMYAAMLAIGDESLNDMAAYYYHVGSLGEISDKKERSYIGLLETFYSIANNEMPMKKQLMVKMATNGDTFESSTIRQIRGSFMESDMFERVITNTTKEMQESMLFRIADDVDLYGMVIKYIHDGFTSILRNSVPVRFGESIMKGVDRACSLEEVDDAGDTLIQFAGSMPSALMKLLSALGSAHGLNEDEIENAIDNAIGQVKSNAVNIGGSMTYLRRIVLMVTALYMLIGSGELGLSGNKCLAYLMRDTIAASTMKAEMSTANVLKLEKQTTPENMICLN